MSRKSGGLSFPADGLAAMRELQALNDAPAVGRADTPTPPAGGQAAPRRGRRPRSVAAERPNGDDSGPAAPTAPPRPDPMAEAVRTLLERPYTADPRTGPFTVSTVKIPTEVWERLGWVAKLSGRTKQEVIAEALREHFRRVSLDGRPHRR